MSLSRDVMGVFAGPGAAAAVAGYVHRQSQVDMAVKVAETIEWGGVSLLEAGTGVGKSFAYLIPAVLSRRKCVVSTATIALQDQLLLKDIPAVGKMLGTAVNASLLKGRGNYLCLRKWNLGGSDVPGWLKGWASASGDGDVGDAPGEIPRHLRPKICGDGLDCLGPLCPSFSDCFYYRARNAARKASIVVLNHHLLLCGLSSGDLVPEAGLLVVDEAHQLPEAAGQCLGIALSISMLDPVIDAVTGSSLCIQRKEELLGWVRESAGLLAVLTEPSCDDSEYPLTRMLPELENLMDACGRLREALSGRDDTPGGAQAAAFIGEAARSVAELEGSDWCVFTEKSGRYQVLKGVPLEPGPALSELVWNSFPGAVLTSATLSVAGDFGYYAGRLGVPRESCSEVFPSPFDYASQAVLSVPENLPSRDDHRSLSRFAWGVASRLAETFQGRTMVLFTSYRNLELALAESQLEPVPGVRVLAQGRMSRRAILEDFRKDPGAVILGTASFWEGIDLAGDLLRGLIIDRIPFPSPGHPLMRARINSLASRGESPFTGLMLPLAAIRLRQGAGRLIRSSRDSGVLVLLDEKMHRSGYGRILMASLPAFRRVTLEEAYRFAVEHGVSGGVSELEEIG